MPEVKEMPKKGKKDKFIFLIAINKLLGPATPIMSLVRMAKCGFIRILKRLAYN